MKKLISPLLCLLALFALAAPAMADVIWEPDDDFYYSHYDECERVEASYEAQTDAPIRKSPAQPAVVGMISAGGEAYVYYSWNGWGYVETQGDSRADGWVDLGDFRRLYNGDDFVRDHQNEITQEDGAVERARYPEIYLWTFPGSGRIGGVIDDSFDWADSDPGYYSVWTDEAGRRWGHVSYYYGMSGWICLSDPDADDLPVTALHYAGDQPEHAAVAGARMRAVVIALVGAVTAGTAGCISRLMRKGKKETNE